MYVNLYRMAPVLFLVLCLVNGLRGAAPFTLIDTRSPESNAITLRCRRNSDDLFEPQAQYFRNGTRVDALQGFFNTNSLPGVVTFLISRRLEGEYSCGTQLQRSYSIPFIGKPPLVHFITFSCSISLSPGHFFFNY